MTAKEWFKEHSSEFTLLGVIALAVTIVFTPLYLTNHDLPFCECSSNSSRWFAVLANDHVIELSIDAKDVDDKKRCIYHEGNWSALHLEDGDATSEVIRLFKYCGDGSHSWDRSSTNGKKYEYFACSNKVRLGLEQPPRSTHSPVEEPAQSDTTERVYDDTAKDGK